MEKEEIEEFVGIPVKLRLSQFGLTGFIEKVFTDSVKFTTAQKSSLLLIKDVTQIVETIRQIWMEQCLCCKRVFIRKTACQKCPYFDCKGKCK